MENDEIHHSAGRVNFDPCPKISYTQFAPLGAISSPVNISPPITISPPSKQHILEQCQLEQDRQRSGMLGLFHKVLGKLQSHASNTIVVNNYFYQGLSFQADYNIYNIMKNFSPTCNIYIRGNNYGFNVYDNSTSQKEEAEADDTNFEEVKPETMVEPFVPSGIDYSKSLLVACFRSAEKAPYCIDWLHQSINSSLPDREKVKPLKALFENHILRYVPNYNDYVQEFGPVVSQSSYSKLMGNGGKYSKDELKDCLEPLLLFFSMEKPKNNLE